MAISITTPAVDTQLTTIESVKSELGIVGSDEHPLLTDYIRQASDMIARFCSRTFAEERVVETVGATGLPEILLTRTPVKTVNSVSFDGGVAITDYTVEDPDAGILFRETLWTSTVIGFGGVIPHPSSYKRPLWSFDYTGGWYLPNWATVANRDLPYDLERACLDLVTNLYRQKGVDPAMSRYRIGDTDITWARKGGLLTDRIESVLQFYRRAV